MMPASTRSSVERESQLPNLSMQRRVIGIVAVALSVTSITLVATSAPWQIRFPVLVAASLYGPAIPLLRLRHELSLEECLVYGLGVNVALQMLAGLSLVMWHNWMPVAASVALLAISLEAGLILLYGIRK